MLLGKIFAEAAMRENKYVTWLPSYGAEVRGGTASCIVIISDEEIGSPYVDKADTLIVLNQPSLEKFGSRLKNNGLLIANSSLILKDILLRCVVVKYPFTEMAIKLGNIRVANMIALGAYLAKKNIISLRSVLNSIEEIAPADKKNLIEINEKAVFSGTNLLKRKQ